MSIIYRQNLIVRYEGQILKHQNKLGEIESVLPDYDNLRNSESANEERKQLLRARRNLMHKIDEIKAIVEDLKTLNDDETPAV